MAGYFVPGRPGAGFPQLRLCLGAACALADCLAADLICDTLWPSQPGGLDFLVILGTIAHRLLNVGSYRLRLEMLRLVVIHQLVLSLLVGPLLCCCTAARLGHEQTASNAGKLPERKSCCGEQGSKDSGKQTPGGKPTQPEKCPCKEAPQTVAVAPEAPVVADSLAFHVLSTPVLNLSLALAGLQNSDRPVPRFDLRSSHLSTADILFAHHNLRC